MRDILLSISVVVVALVLQSCSTDDTTEMTPTTPAMVQIAVVADADSDDSRVAVDGNKTRWEVGDSITVGFVASYFSTVYAKLTITSEADISNDGKRATFRGSVTEGTYYGVAAIYPAVESPSNNITLDREAVDNIFMYSFTDCQEKQIEVTAGTKIPIALKHLMHKMDFKLSLASGYNSDDINSTDIAIEISGTESGRAISFPTTSSLNIRNGMLSTSASQQSIIARGNGSEFSTILFPMTQMRNVELTFGIYIDGEKRYEIVKGPLTTLTMSGGKSTSVSLVLSDDNSASGGDEIVAESITLTASKTSIMANGVDSSKMSVVNDKNEDVTAQSLIYVNNTRLNGTSFITTSAGTYTIYAERYGVRSNSVTITAEEVTSTGKSIVFADGVTLTSGWYDVNKKAEGDNGDINMCWAATSSNMIQWFQDRYKAAGKTLPEGATDGPGVTSYTNYGPYELELMNVFHSEWDNSRGGHMQEAIPWYFEGKLNGGEFASTGSQAVPLTEGGYWKSIWDTEVYPYIYHEYENVIVPGVEGLDLKNLYITIFNNYYHWGNGTSYTGVERLQVFSTLIVEAFRHGMAGLTVNLGANLNAVSHAVTLWGYEIDNATGLVTRLWITDSDDLLSEPKTPLLNEYSVSIDEGKSHIKLTGNTRYGACYVVSIHPFSGYGTSASTTNL